MLNIPRSIEANFFTIGFVSLKNNFCIGVCLELTSVFLNQFFTDFLIVVNLSVEIMTCLPSAL